MAGSYGSARHPCGTTVAPHPCHGKYARIDGSVSLGVVASALVVSLGAQVADPIIGLAITLVILKITWDSWHTVRNAEIDLDHIVGDRHDHAHR